MTFAPGYDFLTSFYDHSLRLIPAQRNGLVFNVSRFNLQTKQSVHRPTARKSLLNVHLNENSQSDHRF